MDILQGFGIGLLSVIPAVSSAWDKPIPFCMLSLFVSNYSCWASFFGVRTEFIFGVYIYFSLHKDIHYLGFPVQPYLNFMIYQNHVGKCTAYGDQNVRLPVLHINGLTILSLHLKLCHHHDTTTTIKQGSAISRGWDWWNLGNILLT